jgi:hypothetical protein
MYYFLYVDTTKAIVKGDKATTDFWMEEKET